MAEMYDAIVIGLGVMGSATLRTLAGRGLRVLGLDRHDPPHSMGSSHGRARMIREAYFEHPLYVPLVRRAYQLWEALEEESGERLLYITRGLSIGPRGCEMLRGALESCRRHGIEAGHLDAPELRRAFPAIECDRETVAVLEPRAGYLLPGPCVAALLDSARREGAEIRTEEARAWRGDGAEAQVETSAGEYRTRSLVLAAGAWMSSLLTDLRLSLTVERVLQLSFAPARPEECTPAALPVFIWEYEPGGFWYGFPAIDGAVKVGLHGGQPVAGPDAASREVTEADAEGARGLVRKHLPAAYGTLVEADVCFYTRTPDGHFIIDRHPDHDRVVIVSACSGHGFKFAPVIGEIVADLLTGNAGAFDLRPFSLARLGR